MSGLGRAAWQLDLDEARLSVYRLYTLRRAANYVRQGFAIVRRTPGLYLLISLIYALPALIAACLDFFLREPAVWQQAITRCLPWPTIVLGTVAIMVAVGYHSRGQPVDLGRVSREALRWAPRYIWTNVHTSLIFWPPIGLLLAARRWQQDTLANIWAPEVLVGDVWWLLITAVAVYLHTRTLLAPFLAVHADLPATLAVMEAWRLGGQHFLACCATLVLGVLPVGVPLGFLAWDIAHNLQGSAQGAMLAAAPDLLWAGIQAIRPVLIPALYLLYRELWGAELIRRQQEEPPRVPGVARVLLSLTQPLPRWGRWD